MWSAEVTRIIGKGRSAPPSFGSLGGGGGTEDPPDAGPDVGRTPSIAARSLTIRIDASPFFTSDTACRQISAMRRDSAFAPVEVPFPGSTKVASSTAARGRSGRAAPRIFANMSAVRKGEGSLYCGKGS